MCVELVSIYYKFYFKSENTFDKITKVKFIKTRKL